jgi:hypothetical protein
MNTDLFLSVFPSHDNRVVLTQKISQCEARRPPLVKVQWTPTSELFVHIGHILNVQEKDLRMVALALSSVMQMRPFMANGEEIKLYGSAIVLRVEPFDALQRIHKTMNHKIQEASNNQYQFHLKGRFDAYLLLGRIKNLNLLSETHKTQLIQLLSQAFHGYSFLIQQAGLVQRLPDKTKSEYQVIQQYPFRG